MTNEGILKKLLTKAEQLGWVIVQNDEEDVCSYSYEFIYLVDTQEFGIYISTENDPSKFLDNLYKIADDFDISYETYLWLDETGHGDKGAPKDMRDVYGNVKYFWEFIKETYAELRKLYLKTLQED